MPHLTTLALTPFYLTFSFALPLQEPLSFAEYHVSTVRQSTPKSVAFSLSSTRPCEIHYVSYYSPLIDGYCYRLFLCDPGTLSGLLTTVSNFHTEFNAFMLGYRADHTNSGFQFIQHLGICTEYPDLRTTYPELFI